MCFSQFRITVFTQSRTDLLKHKKSIGSYGRQFDHSIKYLVSIKTSANPSLSFLTLSYLTRRTHPSPIHYTKPQSVLLYSTILNLFIVYQYHLIYKKTNKTKARVVYLPNPTPWTAKPCTAPYPTTPHCTLSNFQNQFFLKSVVLKINIRYEHHTLPYHYL